MIASTSHDMRTPLNTIINMHELIEQNTENEHVLKWVKISKNTTFLLSSLVNDTLDYFQIK
jgi:signal transduction histidine kinase